MLDNSIRSNQPVQELRELMRKKYGEVDAELAMCWELIELNRAILALEEKLNKLSNNLDKEVHRSFHRLAPYSVPAAPVRSFHSFDDDVTSDDWISTGRELVHG